MAAKRLGQLPLKRIMVRGVNWIGDAVMTTPALATLRSHYPDAEIVMVANPLVAELFAAHPSVDRVMVFDKKRRHQGTSGFWQMASELRKQRFDAAVLLQNAIEAALLSVLALIPRRAGYTTDGRRLLLNHPISVSDADKRLHHTDYYLQLLSRLGIEGGDRKLKLACTSEELDWAKEVLAEENVIAINPGAAYGSAKRWLPERFAAVGDELAKSYDARIVLTGGPGEVEIGNDIAATMACNPLNMVGKTSVRQMMALLASSRLLVTNDSGPMHVASAFDIPIVAVFGSTDHTTTCPASEKVVIVRKETDCAPCLLRQCPIDHRCMTAIQADDVLQAAYQLLDDQP
ncbi:heptosyltransferase-2 [Malonomonas rubra DSM 5091]|uniref:lipopolysaccharide heptosyltransferase II n=1 Tax=Malonomonas rubra DSM 5091 TaxID=1122189 RepID=A0A1M6C7Y8_MALRU|nr:lipopolysaccharide heptosyltransferase II [Malonomonas rubra]SHI57145.1 heptosyltransferase-2 [Malonomonas rubra DSM 5091]